MGRSPVTLRKATALTGAFIIAALAPITNSGAQVRTAPDSGGLQIVDHSSVVRADDVVNLSIRLPGVITSDDTLTVTVHEPIRSEEQFVATTTGLELGGVLATPIQSTLEKLAPDTVGLVDLTLAVTRTPQPQQTDESQPEGVWLAQAGVYPLTIELRTNGQDLIGRLITYLIRLDDSTSSQRTPDPLPVVVALELPNDLPLEDTGSWLAMLAQHEDLPIIVSINPELVLRASTTAELAAFADTSDLRLLTRQPEFPIDEAAFVNAGLDVELDALFSAGDRILDLTRTTPQGSFEVHGHALDVETSHALYRRGVRSVVVGPDSLLQPLPQPPRRPVEIETDGGSLRALLVDDLIDLHNQGSPAAVSQRLAAHLSVIALAGNDAVVTLLLDRNVGLETAGAILGMLADLDLATVTDIGSVIGASLDTQLDNNPTSVALIEAPHVLEGLDAYFEARQHLAAYRSMIRDDQLDDHDRLANEVARSLGTGTSPDDRARKSGEAVAFVRSQLSLIDPPPIPSINLTSREAEVPLSFQNRSTTTLRVELRLISDKLRVKDFDDGETTTLVLEPGITTYDFTFETLTSGSFPLTIELFSPDGFLLVGRTQTTIRATTPSGVGLATSVGAATFLACWWVFDMRRRRRR